MNNLPLTILDSNELYTGSTRILSILTSISDDSFISGQCVLLGKGTSDMEKAMGKALSSEFTPILLEKDTIRDNAFIGLRDYVNSYTHSSDAEKASAAIMLAGIIQTIGYTIYRLGYVDETAKMNSLISSLKSVEAAQSLETIGATGWFQEMEAAQQEFEKTYKSKLDVESAINYPLLKDAKHRITKSLKALISYVESNTELEPDKYLSIEEKINEVITAVLTITRARITRKANEKKTKAEKK